jgi:sugar phosphate isomerase/epimerase
MRPLHLTENQIAQTLGHLQEAGRRGCECVVLWLGSGQDDRIDIRMVYRPDQITQADMFRIPSESMAKIFDIIDKHEVMIAAQVHSHPREAFHSRADDHWAIVRHLDALSLVVPDFGLRTSVKTFFHDMKSYQLNAANRWGELSAHEALQWLKVR